MSEELSRDELMKIYFITAINSDNDTVKAALDNLIVVLRLAETENIVAAIDKRIADNEYAELVMQEAKNILIDKLAAMDAVEDALKNKHPSSIFALDNFLDIWSYNKTSNGREFED